MLVFSELVVVSTQSNKLWGQFNCWVSPLFTPSSRFLSFRKLKYSVHFSCKIHGIYKYSSAWFYMAPYSFDIVSRFTRIGFNRVKRSIGNKCRVFNMFGHVHLFNVISYYSRFCRFVCDCFTRLAALVYGTCIIRSRTLPAKTSSTCTVDGQWKYTILDQLSSQNEPPAHVADGELIHDSYAIWVLFRVWFLTSYLVTLWAIAGLNIAYKLGYVAIHWCSFMILPYALYRVLIFELNSNSKLSCSCRFNLVYTARFHF